MVLGRLADSGVPGTKKREKGEKRKFFISGVIPSRGNESLLEIVFTAFARLG